MSLTRPAGTAVLGRGGLAIRLLALAGALMMGVFAFVTATTAGNSASLVAQDALLEGLLLAGLLLLATMSISVRDGLLVLVGVFTTTTIPATALVSASGQNGLDVVTTDGRAFGHFGYGGSLIGLVTGNRRPATIARRITRWKEESAASTDPAQPVIRRLRRAALLGPPVASLGLCALASVVHATTT